jgi:hypothetical protein
MNKLLLAASIGLAVCVGCDDSNTPKSDPAANTSGSVPTPARIEDAHNHIPIGEVTHSGLKIVATMDAPVKATGGGEGAFDVVITGGKPKAVRFWIGTEDAKGSVKAKAEEETPDNWHVHAEVPNPIPPGSKFWVEVEPPTGQPFKVSFDLKVQ